MRFLRISSAALKLRILKRKTGRSALALPRIYPGCQVAMGNSHPVIKTSIEPHTKKISATTHHRQRNLSTRSRRRLSLQTCKRTLTGRDPSFDLTFECPSRLVNKPAPSALRCEGLDPGGRSRPSPNLDHRTTDVHHPDFRPRRLTGATRQREVFHPISASKEAGRSPCQGTSPRGKPVPAETNRSDTLSGRYQPP